MRRSKSMLTSDVGRMTGLSGRRIAAEIFLLFSPMFLDVDVDDVKVMDGC